MKRRYYNGFTTEVLVLARPKRFELLTPRFVVCTMLLIFLRSVGNPIHSSKRRGWLPHRAVGGEHAQVSAARIMIGQRAA